MTDFCVVIPARYASTRLPGKPLLDIGGKPMLQHVWERAGRSGANRLVIATDDSRIAAQAQGWGAQVCLTRADHPSGTDRLQEVAQQLGLGDDDIVVNVQGDEPLIPPQVIDQVAANLAAAPGASIANLCERIDDWGTLLDPNAVKVVADERGFALYFSRAPIAFPRGRSGNAQQPLPEDGSWWRHIGIYAYRAATLHRFVAWPVAPQEALEQLEQLRALFNGERIHVTQAAETVPGGVDTAADLEKVRAIVANKMASKK